MLLKIHFTDNIPFVGQGVPRSLKTLHGWSRHFPFAVIGRGHIQQGSIKDQALLLHGLLCERWF